MFNQHLSAAASTKTNYCGVIVLDCVSLCRCHCVRPPAGDGIKHPAHWQQHRLVCELHLHSWKDNQPTGVFNLKYVCWTINHSAQPLRTAQRQGWTYFSPWQASTSPLSWADAPPLQRECPLLIRFTQGRLYCDALHFSYDSSWDDGIVSAGGYIWLLEDCSVKCLGWSLNSSCQHQFTDPVVEAVVEENVIHAGENGGLSLKSEGEQEGTDDRKKEAGMEEWMGAHRCNSNNTLLGIYKQWTLIWDVYGFMGQGRKTLHTVCHNPKNLVGNVKK